VLWIGTEDKGLWRLDLKADPAAKDAWKQFTSKDTATDHVYGIAVDTLDRVWVGTVNRGVSVYNGSQWRNYGVLDGCSGERVFAIAADSGPKRGNVWIGTDHGLVCWSPDLAASPPPTAQAAPERGGSPYPPRAAAPPPASPRDAASALAKGTWRTYTQADGLPSAQVYAVAVAPTGRVWVGTECDGLAWADPPYRKWQCIRAAAERSGNAGELPGVGEKGAPGLPSNLTNGLAILLNGTVVVSTDYGLGIGRSGGLVWTSWQGLSKQPYENYTRGLAADSAGLWIATRHKGLARLDLNTGKVKTYQRPAVPDNYVFSVAVTAGGDVWAGTYGGGLARLRTALAAAKTPAAAPASVASGASSLNPQSAIRNPQLPEPLGPPTLDELNAMLAALAKVPFVPPEKQPVVVRLDDDWLTKGDCLGRYGRYWGCWCAIRLPDCIWGAGPEIVEHSAFIGPNCKQPDGIRCWVHWRYTKNPNSLEMPPIYYHSRVLGGFTTPDFIRRQAEWDDHGEAYPMSKDGPSLYCNLRIPAGQYVLSLYNFNKDGHTGNNRFRDYRLSIRSHAAREPLWEATGFEKMPELARARMTDFWNGTYKRFLVRGPTEITFNVNRNHSHNAILAGVFVDLVDELPVPYFHTLDEWKALCARRDQDRSELKRDGLEPPARAARFAPAPSAPDAAARVFDELERLRLVNALWWARQTRVFYAALARWNLAALKSSPAGPEKQRLYARAATCYYQTGLYEKWEAGQTLLGKTPPRQIEKTLPWDSGHDFRSQGYEVITQYLRRLHRSSEAAESR
jgi:hypothetical protein